MALARWKRLTRKDVLTNNWWTYRLDEFEIPGGVEGEYHYVHTEGASLIVPQLDDGSLVLVRQYRYLCERESLEFPCGGVKKGSSFEQTAVAELREEAGYVARTMQLVGEFNPYNGVTDEICRVYVATGLQQVGHRRESTEEMELEIVSMPDLTAKMLSGEIWDGMTLAAWTIAGPFIKQ